MEKLYFKTCGIVSVLAMFFFLGNTNVYSAKWLGINMKIRDSKMSTYKINYNLEKDKIAIIAPSAMAHTLDESKRNLHAAINILNAKGFKVSISENIFANSDSQVYYHYAAPTQERFNQFKQALLDPEVKIIWCFRGGAGGNEIVHELIRQKIEPNGEKVIIGFSDITNFLLYSTQVLKYPAVHAPVLNQISKFPSEINNTIDFILERKNHELNLSPINSKAYSIDDPIISKISGGNLSIIATLIGTNLHPNFDNKILILENTSVYPHQVKRDLVHLLEAGVINKKLTAIIFGQFDNSHKEYEEKNIDAIRDFVKTYIKNDLPCFLTKEFGHQNTNKPIPFNVNAALYSNRMKYETIFDIMKSN